MLRARRLGKAVAAAPRTKCRFDARGRWRRIGAERLRLAPAAVGALVLPGMDLQIAAIEKVKATDDGVAAAFRTVASGLGTRGHGSEFPMHASFERSFMGMVST